MVKPLTISTEVVEGIVGPCPKCGAALSKELCVANNSVRKPQPGDVSICYTCTAFLKFDGALMRVELTSEEEMMLPLPVHRDLCRVRELIVRYKEMKATKI